MSDPLSIWREIIAKQKPRKIRGAFWYRAIIKTRRSTILSADGAYLNGGRYNPAEEFGALYLSESLDGCKAEHTRRPAAPTKKYVVGTIRVNLNKIFDLADEDLLEELGLDVDEIRSDDIYVTQILGTIVRDSGFEGIIAPSAAGDFTNLIVFVDRISGSSKVELEDVNPM